MNVGRDGGVKLFKPNAVNCRWTRTPSVTALRRCRRRRGGGKGGRVYSKLTGEGGTGKSSVYAEEYTCVLYKVFSERAHALSENDNG